MSVKKTFVILWVGVAIVVGRPGASLATLFATVILIVFTIAQSAAFSIEASRLERQLNGVQFQLELPPDTDLPVLEANCRADDTVAAMNEGVHLEEKYSVQLSLKEPLDKTPPMEIAGPAPTTQIGLIVTEDLEEVRRRCRGKVERISKQCRKENRKFRDIEFDLEKDGKRCYFGLNPHTSRQMPTNVKRVSEIFKKPQFFIDGPGSSDVVQGALGDCWFLSALSALATLPGMVENICVARDEGVGVYGFVFFRDNRWVDVIIDDQLFWSTPKYEQLTQEEKMLYREDRDLYKEVTSGNGRGLHFARSETNDETWVPLIEKAYAKLHGDYMSLAGGLMYEGVEDLTGGVSQIFSTADILDPERFWKEELVQADAETNLFGVSLPSYDSTRKGGSSDVLVSGLIDSHAYCVLRAKECKGKRFVVIRNPWGSFEWTGRWSDGSKEWTSEWYGVLKDLDHVLGDDGEFVMEYCDFLEIWRLVQRTTILDSSWTMSSYWLEVPPKPMDYMWTFGELFFSFTVSNPSMTMIVLSQVDARYFSDLDGRLFFSIDFVVYKRGEPEPRGESYSSTLGQRSVSCRLDLEAGEYIVYPRIDRFYTRDMGYFEECLEELDYRKLSRVLTSRTESRSISANYNVRDRMKFISTSAEQIIEQESDKEESFGSKTQSIEANKTISTSVTRVQVSHDSSPRSGPENKSAAHKAEVSPTPEPPEKISVTGDNEDDTPASLGLKVYTKRKAVVVVTGHIGTV